MPAISTPPTIRTRSTTSRCRHPRARRSLRRGGKSRRGSRRGGGGYRVTATAQRNLQTSQMDAYGVNAAYENECFIVALLVNRRVTSYNGDNGSTSAILQVTFKTVGTFGFNAL